MKKIIVYCHNCTKRIKITNKIAKYKCPHCSNIYKFNLFKFIFINIEHFFMSIIDKVINKFNNFKNAYSYTKQLKKNMKSHPNWSNYKKQQREEKINSPSLKNKIKAFFR